MATRTCAKYLQICILRSRGESAWSVISKAREIRRASLNFFYCDHTSAVISSNLKAFFNLVTIVCILKATNSRNLHLSRFYDFLGIHVCFIEVSLIVEQFADNKWQFLLDLVYRFLDTECRLMQVQRCWLDSYD